MKRAFQGFAATAALAAVVGISACSSSTAPSTSAPAGGSVQGVPIYHPSTVRSKTDTTATLTSPDSVTKVTDYYVSVINSGGWDTVAKSVTQFSGNLTVKKSGTGAHISVAPSGSGSLVSISTYPV
jgi:hypothetical protein